MKLYMEGPLDGMEMKSNLIRGSLLDCYEIGKSSKATYWIQYLLMIKRYGQYIQSVRE